MRIHEILTESELQQLDEGPIGSALGAVGRGVGKAVGGVAKGVGAVAGGVRGAFTALKKGYQAGKAVVGDDPDPNAGAPGYTYVPKPEAPAPTQATTPAPTPAPAPTPSPDYTAPAPTTAKDINAQGPEGTVDAKTQTGPAATALAKTDAVTDKQTATKAGETVYAQIKANVDKLDTKGKQRIMTLLQKSIAQTPAKTAAKPAAAPAGGAGAFGQMAQQLAGKPPNTMANAPVSATNTAKPDNPNLAKPAAAAPAADAAAPAGQGAFANVASQLTPKPTGRPQGGGRVKGAGPSMTPGAIKKRDTRAAAKAAAAAAPVTASLVHPGRSLNEMLQEKIKTHQRTMFETQLRQGTASVFIK